MFIKNVSKKDIINYDCGFENVITIKVGETIELADPRAVKSLLHLLSPQVEVAKKPEVKKVEKKVEVKKPTMFKKVLKRK